MFQVLRWGALVFGVFYGFSHQTAITAQDKIAASKHEYERKEKLISQAKAAWAQKNAPKGQSNGCKSRTILSSKSGNTGTLGRIDMKLRYGDRLYDLKMSGTNTRWSTC